MTIVNANNGGDDQITVEKCGDKVQLCLLSNEQGRHTICHTVIIDHPEDALKLAEGIREAATAAQVYRDNNPN